MIKYLLILLTLCGVSRADAPAADWWKAHVEGIFAPEKVHFKYQKIETAEDQSIVITLPAIWFWRQADGQPVLLTADRMILQPAGNLDPTKPFALTDFKLERPVINLALAARKDHRPSTQPTTMPSLAAAQSVMKSLQSVEIRDGVIILFAGSANSRANLTAVSLDAKRNDQNEWAGRIAIDAVSARWHIESEFKIVVEVSKTKVAIQTMEMHADLDSTGLLKIDRIPIHSSKR